jgi:membrane protease YdiL (CAAX protease family)
LLGFLFSEAIGSVIAMFILGTEDSIYTIGLLGIVFATIPTLIILFRKNKDNKTKFLKTLKSENFFFSVFGGVTFYILISYLLALLFLLLPKTITDTYTLGDEIGTVSSDLLIFISTGICAPIIEEVFFRYGIQTTLQKINPIFALCAQSFLFGVAHGNIIQGIYAFIVGMLLGFVYYKTQNLLYPILIHMTFNSLNFVVMKLNIVSQTPLYLIALVFFIIGWIIIRQKNKKIKGKIDAAMANFSKVSLSSSIGETTIKDAEQLLNLKFAQDYKYFLSSYEFLCFNNFSINGLRCPDSYSVVDNTIAFRNAKDIPKDFYVLQISENGDTAILQNESGKVYFYNNFGTITLLYDSLSRLLTIESQRIVRSNNVKLVSS